MPRAGKNCKFAEGIRCNDTRNCERCGWNPEVAAERFYRLKTEGTTALGEKTEEVKS